jgi:hypothetical protein
VAAQRSIKERSRNTNRLSNDFPRPEQHQAWAAQHLTCSNRDRHSRTKPHKPCWLIGSDGLGTRVVAVQACHGSATARLSPSGRNLGSELRLSWGLRTHAEQDLVSLFAVDGSDAYRYMPRVQRIRDAWHYFFAFRRLNGYATDWMCCSSTQHSPDLLTGTLTPRSTQDTTSDRFYGQHNPHDSSTAFSFRWLDFSILALPMFVQRPRWAERRLADIVSVCTLSCES